MKIKINYERYNCPAKGGLLNQVRWYARTIIYKPNTIAPITITAEGESRLDVKNQIIERVYSELAHPGHFSEEVEIDL